MVFRLPLLSSLWVPITICLFAASLSISESSSSSSSNSDDKLNDDDTDGDTIINANGTRRNLTGNPQIDWSTDPNLPRELNGYNLSSYPFFNKVPTNITFKCDGLKDGFYASVEHSCQLYHHCLFGTRYDFLCANYTAFDQRTFICQFVSDVDCPNSPLFFNRNDALYVAKSTTPAPIAYGSIGGAGGERGRGRQRYTPAPLLPNKKKQSDLPAAVESSAKSQPSPNSERGGKESELQKQEEIIDDYADTDAGFYRQRPRGPRPRGGLRRRPGRRRLRPRPAYYDYDYYDYVDDEPYVRRPQRTRGDRYDDDYYETDSEEELPKRRVNKRKHRRRQYYNADRGDDVAEDEVVGGGSSKPSKLTASQRIETISSQTTATTTTTTPEPAPPLDPVAMSKTREELFTQSRAPPRIKPPVPLSERNKYNQMQGRILVEQPSSTAPAATQQQTSRKKAPPPVAPVKAAEVEQYDQAAYYDDDYEQTQAPAKKSSKYLPLPTTTVATTTTKATTKSTTTTSTTTPAPQTYEDYEYEEYDDEQSQQQMQKIPTTTTTTTTTTPKPNSSNRKYRNNRKRQEDSGQMMMMHHYQQASTAPESVQESSGDKYDSRDGGGSQSNLKHVQINEAVETPSRVQSLRQPYMTRPRPTFFSKSSPSSTPITPITSTSTTTTTSERSSPVQVESMRMSEMIDNQRYSAVYDVQDPVEATTQRSRTSQRFWQRQPKVADVTTTTTTTTTTPAPEAEAADYAYYDENIPLTRYGQRSASTYPTYMPDAPLLLNTPLPTIQQQQQQQPGDTMLNYQQQQQQQEQQQLQNYRTNSYQVPKVPEQSNYVTPFGPPVGQSKTTVATYLQFHQPHLHHHPHHQQQPQQPPSHHPEFISLLPDDEEESYYPTAAGGVDARSSHIMTMMSPLDAQSSHSQPQPQAQQQPQQQQQQQLPIVPQATRFRNQITRMFAAPQELYPAYTSPPQYIKQVRPRHVFPTMFIPYSTF